MPDEFPRSDPAAAPEAPQQSAPSRKGMLVVYHGDGTGKEVSARGVLFRAHGRGLPVRFLCFAAGTTNSPSGDSLALDRLGIPANFDGCEGPGDAADLWGEALRHLENTKEGVLVLESLLDVVENGWLSVAEVVSGLANKRPLLHVIVTGQTAPPELVTVADLVTEMRTIKKRPDGAPLVAGIDY